MRQLLDEVAREAEILDGMPTITDNEVNMEQQPVSTKVETGPAVYLGSRDQRVEPQRFRERHSPRVPAAPEGTTARPLHPAAASFNPPSGPPTSPDAVIATPANLGTAKPTGVQKGSITQE
jgi:hypothetical protein